LLVHDLGYSILQVSLGVVVRVRAAANGTCATFQHGDQLVSDMLSAYFALVRFLVLTCSFPYYLCVDM
jgi:hypothetical protein